MASLGAVSHRFHFHFNNNNYNNNNNNIIIIIIIIIIINDYIVDVRRHNKAEEGERESEKAIVHVNWSNRNDSHGMVCILIISSVRTHQ